MPVGVLESHKVAALAEILLSFRCGFHAKFALVVTQFYDQHRVKKQVAVNANDAIASASSTRASA